MVAVARNRYSVPCELVDQRVSARLYSGRVEIVSDEVIVAGHERLPNRGALLLRLAALYCADPAQAGALRNDAPFADMRSVPLPRCAIR